VTTHEDTYVVAPTVSDSTGVLDYYSSLPRCKALFDLPKIKGSIEVSVDEPTPYDVQLTDCPLIHTWKTSQHTIARILPGKSKYLKTTTKLARQVDLSNVTMLMLDRVGNVPLNLLKINRSKITCILVADDADSPTSSVQVYKGIKFPNLKTLRIVGQGRGDEYLFAKGVENLNLGTAHITPEYLELIKRINPKRLAATNIKAAGNSSTKDLEDALRSRLIPGPDLELMVSLMRGCTKLPAADIPCNDVMVSCSAISLLNYISPSTLESLAVVNGNHETGDVYYKVSGDSFTRFANLKRLSVTIFSGELKQDLDYLNCCRATGEYEECFPSSTGVMTGAVLCNNYPDGYGTVKTMESVLYIQDDRALHPNLAFDGNLCVRHVKQDLFIPDGVKKLQIGTDVPNLTLVRKSAQSNMDEVD